MFAKGTERSKKKVKVQKQKSTIHALKLHPLHKNLCRIPVVQIKITVLKTKGTVKVQCSQWEVNVLIEKSIFENKCHNIKS